MKPAALFRAYADARRTAGPCTAYRAATGRAIAAPLQLFAMPRRRQRRMLRALQQAALALVVLFAACGLAGCITFFFPLPF